MPLRTPLSDRNRRPTGGSSRSCLPCVKSRVRNLLHSVNSTTASDEEAIDSIEEISHPEEAAKQLSRRTHNGIPADRRFPYTLRKPGPTALGARTVHRSVSHCYRLSGRSRRRDGSRRSPRKRQNIWVSRGPRHRFLHNLPGAEADRSRGQGRSDDRRLAHRVHQERPAPSFLDYLQIVVLPVGIEPTTSPLPRECSTTELRQHWGVHGNTRRSTDSQVRRARESRD